MSKFLRTIERTNLNELAQKVLAEIEAAESAFQTSKKSLEERKEAGEITEQFFTDNFNDAIKALEKRYSDARRFYGPRFDEIIEKLNTLADAVRDPEITEDEARALAALQGMLQSSPNHTISQQAFNAAVSHWNGSSVIREGLEQIARENSIPLMFTALKPKTTHLTKEDVKEIGDDISFIAKQYFDAHDRYRPESDSSHWDTEIRKEKYINNAARWNSEKEMKRLANVCFNPFTFNDIAAKLFEFDELCEITEI